MSFHYSLILSLELDLVCAVDNASVLRYVFNAVDCPPDAYPEHEYFRIFDPKYRFHRSYSSFPEGAWQSAFWTLDGPAGLAQAGVFLKIPGNKLEGVYQDMLPLASWLASLAKMDGCIGFVQLEDGSLDDEPTVLYAQARRLYVGKSRLADAFAFDDGAPPVAG